jgi:predicted lactoylglutathione lyase
MEEAMAAAQHPMIFVNLPVKDLDKSVAFFTKLGFTFNPQFTDETATCMIVNDQGFVMLLVENKFKEFTKKAIGDTKTHTEVILAISAESRAQVDELADKALAAGGQPSIKPMDLGFMYNRSFQDLDGHLWEVFYMDPSAVPQ